MELTLGAKTLGGKRKKENQQQQQQQHSVIHTPDILRIKINKQTTTTTTTTMKTLSVNHTPKTGCNGICCCFFLLFFLLFPVSYSNSA
jgi:hypothetical protein